jgi:hypothetical protein
MVAWTLTYATGCAYSLAGLNAEWGAWYSPWLMCCCWGDGMYCACCGACGERVTQISEYTGSTCAVIVTHLGP